MGVPLNQAWDGDFVGSERELRTRRLRQMVDDVRRAKWLLRAWLDDPTVNCWALERAWFHLGRAAEACEAIRA